MNIRIFELERVQSVWENTVDFNLTESGFHPLKLNEFLTAEQLADLEDTVLGYGQTNGSIALREAIAGLYPRQGSDNVLVTNGSAEANFVACHTLLEAADEVVMMIPNYMQIWGVVEEMGAIPRAFHLREENRWAPDLAELRCLVNEKTKMIVLCNPNNPTGYVLTSEEMQEIVGIADEVGAWIYADEIYRGAELDGVETTSFLGDYPRTLVCGGLSKAYALPGLRLGWLAGPAATVADAWAYHDYTTITAGILSHKIGEIALSQAVRTRILERNRSMLRENLQVMQAWVDDFGDVMRFIPPQAGGMTFMHYELDICSTELADWLRREQSVFILAGDCYGMDHYFRLGIGAEKEHLVEGLERIRRSLEERFGV
ncbi:MAG: aminotransferase class I/II-fold pyridoxal phosphate-dependent enzyme [Candidatus Bipolaricaulia bacterium]